MAEYNSNRYSYQYGSAAPKYPQTPDFEPLKRPKPQKKSKEDILFVTKMSLGGLVLFMGAFSFVHLCSALSIKQGELKIINKEIRETESAINSVQATIASNLNLEAIQKTAEEKLNMSEPLPHQVVYIEVAQESYTSYNE